MDLATLALTLAVMMGHDDAEGRVIASTIGAICQSSDCVLDAAVFAEHESGWRLHPHPYSKDAKANLSLGPLQVQGAGVRLDDQVRRWVNLRAWSLNHCGDLTGLASGQCGVGTKLVNERSAEASAWGYIVHWKELP